MVQGLCSFSVIRCTCFICCVVDFTTFGLLPDLFGRVRAGSVAFLAPDFRCCFLFLRWFIGWLLLWLLLLLAYACLREET